MGPGRSVGIVENVRLVCSIGMVDYIKGFLGIVLSESCSAFSLL